MGYCLKLFILRFVCVGTVIVYTAEIPDESNKELEVLTGSPAALPCNVTAETEGDKLTVLKWYKSPSNNAIYSRDLRNELSSNVVTSDSRYQLSVGANTSSLVITDARASDSAVYTCQADFADSPTLTTKVQLLVIVPPHRLWVGHVNGSKIAWVHGAGGGGGNVSDTIGPYYIGDYVSLYCVTLEGKPPPTITWWEGDTPLKNTSTPLSAVRLRSDVTKGPLTRDDHGAELACSANNNDVTPPLVVRLTIDMILPPELVTIRTKEANVSRVRAGESLSLQCRVLGATPVPSIVWRVNDGQLLNLEQTITLESFQRLVVSEVSVSVEAAAAADELRAACCAAAPHRDAPLYKCAEPIHIAVTYPPSLKIIPEGTVENRTVSVWKDSSFRMNCSYTANPSVFELIWYRDDIVITNTTDKEGQLIDYSLSFPAVSEQDAGEYYCAASNVEGSTTSDPIQLNVIYAPECEDQTIWEYGLAPEDELNLTCVMKANPPTTIYHWFIVDEALDRSTIRATHPYILGSQDNVLTYKRPNNVVNSTIICLGASAVSLCAVARACAWRVSAQTPPRAPVDCRAVRRGVELRVTCLPGHDGGETQEFTLTIKATDTEQQLISITKPEPTFVVQEPKEEIFVINIVATNIKGSSPVIEIAKEDILLDGEEWSVSAVADIVPLSLSLCGVVLLLALAACGLALCHAQRDETRTHTRESICESYSSADEDCQLHRTDSFRRAISQCPSRNYDIRRTSSFHSPRCLNVDTESIGRCDTVKRAPACRVHSMHNISRKREMDALCERLHLAPEPSYSLPRQSNSFYTIPRKIRQKSKEMIDDTTDFVHNSDDLSLPPPPDEFSIYRLGTKVKELPSKAIPTYSTISKKPKLDSRRSNDVIISSLNTVGLPTVSGNQASHSQSGDVQQVNRNPFENSE